MSRERVVLLRSALVLLVLAAGLGALLASRVGLLGALGALGVAVAVVAPPAVVFVRRERRRLLAEAAVGRAPVHCTCCDPGGLHTTATA